MARRAIITASRAAAEGSPDVAQVVRRFDPCLERRPDTCEQPTELLLGSGVRGSPRVVPRACELDSLPGRDLDAAQAKVALASAQDVGFGFALPREDLEPAAATLAHRLRGHDGLDGFERSEKRRVGTEG